VKKDIRERDLNFDVSKIPAEGKYRVLGGAHLGRGEGESYGRDASGRSAISCEHIEENLLRNKKNSHYHSGKGTEGSSLEGKKEDALF